MRICVPVTNDGRIDPRWGRAERVAVASVEAGRLADWKEHEVGWNRLHDSGTEGSHHARVARFLLDQKVEMVVAHHMGAGMQQMLDRMGVAIILGAGGDARAAATAALA